MTMKGSDMRISILAGAMAVSICLLFSCAVQAQSGDAGKGEQKMPDSRGKTGDLSSLTDEQKAAVKSILSKYNISTMTADNAKAIHKAFRDAGLRSGPGLNAAVTAAGFNPDTLRDLDPPADKKSRGEGGAPESNEKGPKEREQSIKQ
jgi:Spy/CpxP family protein refolding chaperone